MKNQNAIIAMLAIMSIAALAGVFTVQIADAQLPSLSVGTGGVEIESEEFDLLGAGPDFENGVDLVAREFGLGLSVQPAEVSIIPLGR
jgi:Flp pilus assembly protein CpaB